MTTRAERPDRDHMEVTDKVLVLFLASEDSSFVTGTAHPVDGGWHSSSGSHATDDQDTLAEVLKQE